MATEKRLIDANALIEQFDESNFKGFVMKRLIEMQPTVDAVEVVRCWECRYGDMCSIREAMAVSDWNAYCFRGERRTDGN